MPVSLSHTRPGQQHECGRGVISRSMRGSGTLRCVRMLRVRTTNAVPRVSLVFPFRICHQTGKSVGARTGGTTSSPNTPAGSRRIAQTNRTTIPRHTACQYVAMAEVQRARLVALAHALTKNTHRAMQNGLGLATSSAVILKGRFRTNRIRFTCRAQPPREDGDQRAHARLHTPTNLGGQTGVCTSAECAVHAYQAKCGALQVLPPAALLHPTRSLPRLTADLSIPQVWFFREPPSSKEEEEKNCRGCGIFSPNSGRCNRENVG